VGGGQRALKRLKEGSEVDHFILRGMLLLRLEWGYVAEVQEKGEESWEGGEGDKGIRHPSSGVRGLDHVPIRKRGGDHVSKRVISIDVVRNGSRGSGIMAPIERETAGGSK